MMSARTSAATTDRPHQVPALSTPELWAALLRCPESADTHIP